jgi:DNA-binding transcriptional LysR family regulator
MELHQLRYFVSVAEVGSFTGAARTCNVAQPSLSQQVRKLEEELGHLLFERLGRRVRLTAAGRSFYEKANAVLSAAAEARDAFRAGHAADQGEIRIGAIPTVAPYLLPGLLRSFRRAYARAEVTVHEDLTAEIVRGCVAGELDLGIAALPIEETRLTVRPLFSEQLLLAVPAGHPFSRKRRVTLLDVSRERFVLLSEVHCLGAQIVRLCDREGCTPAVVCRSAQLLTVQELVGLGKGISLVPEMAARSDRSRRIAYRSLSGSRPFRTLAMICHRQRYQSALLRGFVRTLHEHTGRASAR